MVVFFFIELREEADKMGVAFLIIIPEKYGVKEIKALLIVLYIALAFIQIIHFHPPILHKYSK